ncbi:PREDICTED: uncharacterized protein LOC104823419 [Tarenaya hassleriana]|uniref:uncharacterized protein LOC104823419 n=1 Tax=Tarenaya hassleriana TaxID=28532 RepID=UPI00053C49D6|nr:PREDICTED: uncharacterized protein LOC104823419 [Tarenaya hassleriana]
MGLFEGKMIWAVGLFLITFPTATLCDNFAFPPSLSPFLDKVCEKVECGRGRCRVDRNEAFGFRCECDDGWKTSFDGSNHTFLPCIVPDCNINSACAPAPPPTPEKEIPRNRSFFDPCHWAYCGGGTCRKDDDDDFKHTCDCNNGFTNLLNKTYFPCFGQCDLGSNCSRIISSANAEDSSPANSYLPGKFQILTMIFTSMAMALAS